MYPGTCALDMCPPLHLALWGLMVDYNHIAYRLLLPKDVCDL